MILDKIKPGDLIFTNSLEDDRTNTYLTLNDYDWMSYTLKTRFMTDKLGDVRVEFNYFGLTTSTMEVIRAKGKSGEKYKYSYPTELFQKHITTFLTKHIGSWDSKYSFNGENEVIEFFNDVLELGELEMTA